MTKAPFTQAKTYDHEDVDCEFEGGFISVMVDLGAAFLIFLALVSAIVVLLNFPDKWTTWAALAIGGL
jgi:hypothetical protein